MVDTRPRFLGGHFTSKVKVNSEVREYLDKTSHFLTSRHMNGKASRVHSPGVNNGDLVSNHGEDEQQASGVDVRDYFATKMKLKKNIDKYFKQQVQQYHHDNIIKSARNQNKQFASLHRATVSDMHEYNNTEGIVFDS